MKKKKSVKVNKEVKLENKETHSHHITEFDKDLKDLTEQELRELLMINMYKMALLRSQLEAVSNILIKNKLATYEEIWKETNDNFKNTI